MRTCHDYAHDAHFGSRALMGENSFSRPAHPVTGLVQGGTVVHGPPVWWRLQHITLLLPPYGFLILLLPQYAPHQATEVHMQGVVFGESWVPNMPLPLGVRMKHASAPWGTHEVPAKATETSRFGTADTS